MTRREQLKVLIEKSKMEDLCTSEWYELAELAETELNALWDMWDANTLVSKCEAVCMLDDSLKNHQALEGALHAKTTALESYHK